jgi:hypothetical protein
VQVAVIAWPLKGAVVNVIVFGAVTVNVPAAAPLSCTTGGSGDPGDRLGFDIRAEAQRAVQGIDRRHPVGGRWRRRDKGRLRVVRRIDVKERPELALALQIEPHEGLQGIDAKAGESSPSIVSSNS